MNVTVYHRYAYPPLIDVVPLKTLWLPVLGHLVLGNKRSPTSGADRGKQQLKIN